MKAIIQWSVILMFVIFCGLSGVQAEDNNEPPEAALSFVQDWLRIVDGGSYAASWHDLSPVLRQDLAQEQWIQELEDFRTPLGSLSQRTRTSVTRASDHEIGEYVIVQYESTFANKGPVSEAISVIKGVGDRWRVLGYSIF
ncbi:MAG: DUF4019 domain-containing protein [Desulfohalobiaceae bacterium]|nr:DUF4019 domain-containing protein [Desulfohalobiaceae bacterium]